MTSSSIESVLCTKSARRWKRKGASRDPNLNDCPDPWLFHCLVALKMTKNEVDNRLTNRFIYRLLYDVNACDSDWNKFFGLLPNDQVIPNVKQTK